ncbi:MAG: hypothetical protein ACLFUY_00235 [Desulfobacterales bacterium]
MHRDRFPAPKGGFYQSLVSANQLENTLGCGTLLFFPGMLFESRQKWWGRGGMRDQSHEGVDICFFADSRGNCFRLDETTRVPAAFDGEAAGIIPDFLGSTVILAHQPDDLEPSFFALYAHLRPDAGLCKGRHLSAGQTFAAIAPPHANKALPPHLHLSMMDAHSIPPLESLDWPLLNGLDRNRFMDPLEIIEGDWQMMDFTPGMNLYEVFAPAGARTRDTSPGR